MTPTKGAALLNTNSIYIFDDNANMVFDGEYFLAYHQDFTNYDGYSLYGGHAVDNNNGWIYLCTSMVTLKLDFGGNLLATLPTGPVASIAIDDLTGNLWALHLSLGNSTIKVFDSNGNLLTDIDGAPGGQTIRFDASSQAFWVASQTNLYKVSVMGSVVPITLNAAYDNIIIRGFTLDPVADRVWVSYASYQPGQTMYDSNCYGTIAALDLEGNQISAFLYPNYGTTTFDSNLQNGPGYLNSNNFTYGTGLSLSPMDGHVFVSYIAYDPAGSYEFINGFLDVEGSFTPSSQTNAVNLITGVPGFDNEGNFWQVNQYLRQTASNAHVTTPYSQALCKYDSSFNVLASNCTASCITSAQGIAFNDLFTFDLKQQAPAATVTPYLETAARLMQHYTLNGTALEESSVYRVEISARANNLPYDTTINLKAQSDINVLVNGNTYSLNNTTPVSFSVNYIGKLVIDIPAIDLNVPSLFVNAAFMSSANDYLVVNPAQQLHNNLSTVTASRLQQAPTGGTALLPDTQFTADQADQVASAIRNVMSVSARSFEITDADAGTLQGFIAGVPTPSIIPSIRYRQMQEAKQYVAPGENEQQYDPLTDKLDVSFISNVASLPDVTGYLVPELIDREAAHWSISFGNGSLTSFAILSESEALASISQLDGAGLTPNNIFSAAWNSFVSGVTQVAQIVVTTVSDAVSSVREGISEIVQSVKVFISNVGNFVVKTIGQAVSFLKGIFAQLKIGIDKVITFFKSLFEWDDILYTQQIIKYQVNCLNGTLNAMITNVQNMVVSNILSFKANMTSLFSNYRTQLAGVDLGYSFEQGKTEQGMQGNVSAGWFSNTLQENLPGATGGPGSAVLSCITTILAELETLGNNISNEPGFNAARAYFEKMVQDPSTIPQLLAVGIMSVIEGILDTILDTAVALINIFTKVLTTLITEVFNLLNQELYIPVLTEVYQLCTGQKLSVSMLDIFTFAIAAPATIIYKLIKGTAPFTQTDVAELTSGLQSNVLNANAPSYKKWNVIRNCLAPILSTVVVGLTVASDGQSVGNDIKSMGASAAKGAQQVAGFLNKNLSGVNAAYVNIGIAVLKIVGAGITGDPLDTLKAELEDSVEEYNKSLPAAPAGSPPPPGTLTLEPADVKAYQAFASIIYASAALDGFLDLFYTYREQKLAKQNQYGTFVEMVRGLASIGFGSGIAVLAQRYKVKHWELTLTGNVLDGAFMAISPLCLRKNPIILIGLLTGDLVCGLGSAAVNFTIAGLTAND